MLDHDQLETFATVAEEQSFDKAALKLNITRSAVSQRIKALEESVSRVLLVRDRPVTPTPAGEILLRYVKAIRLFESAALCELAPQPRPGQPVTFPIAVNADSLATWFPPVLQQILLRPQTAIEVISDDQDHTVSRLARGEVIGCISTDPHPAPGFIAESLGVMTYRCCATPAYAQEHFPNGLTVPDVLRATAVLFNRKDALHDEFLSSVFGFPIDRYARHYLPSPAALLEAITIGAGYGLVPGAQCEGPMHAGQLVDLAPEHAVDVALYWHHWELEPPMAREITALIVEVASHQLQAPLDPEALYDDLLNFFQDKLPFDQEDRLGTFFVDPATPPDASKPHSSDTRSASPNSKPDQASP
jgi:LysR family transcriptional regulator, chromosome initiation inhibitor